MAEKLRVAGPEETAFDPRAGALAHAGMASRCASVGTIDDVAGEGVNAAACGLVYVGDQILRLATIVAVALSNGTAEEDVAAVADALNGSLRAPAPAASFAEMRSAIRGEAIAKVWDKMTMELAERIPAHVVNQIVDDTLAVVSAVVEGEGVADVRASE